MDKTLNVLFLSDHNCIRVIKEGVALRKQGVKVYYLCRRIANADLTTMLPLVSFWSYEKDLRRRLQEFEGMDVIHVHNEPSWFVKVVKEVHPDIPVVFDVHDLNSDRFGEKNDEETAAFEHSDAVLTISQHYKKHIREFWGYKKQVEVIYSYVNEELIGVPKLPKINGVVYQGGLTWQEGHWRDMRQVVKSMVQMGYPFHIYPASENAIDPYIRLGATVHHTLGYVYLLQNLSRYDWSWVAPSTAHPALLGAMPNKLFESLAAGVPILTTPDEAEVAEFVKKNNVGVVLENAITDLKEVYDTHRLFRPVILNKRKEWTMETQTEKILSVYNSLIKKS